MPTVEIITLASNAVDLLSKVLPLIQKIHSGGTATVEEQAEVKAAYQAFVDSGDNMFKQPHWKVE